MENGVTNFSLLLVVDIALTATHGSPFLRELHHHDIVVGVIVQVHYNTSYVV